MLQLQAEAEKKNRAHKIQAEEKRRADEIQMAKIQADKELTLKEMKLKAQAQTSTNAVVDPPPRNRDATILQRRKG